MHGLLAQDAKKKKTKGRGCQPACLYNQATGQQGARPTSHHIHGSQTGKLNRSWLVYKPKCPGLLVTKDKADWPITSRPTGLQRQGTLANKAQANWPSRTWPTGHNNGTMAPKHSTHATGSKNKDGGVEPKIWGNGQVKVGLGNVE